MKKSLKALAVLSLFGLGLGSVTACGGSSKSITISVNGNQLLFLLMEQPLVIMAFM